MANHMLIKLLMDVNSDRLGSARLGLVCFGSFPGPAFYLYLSLSPYEHIVNSYTPTKNIHRTCAGQWVNIKQYGWLLFASAWLRRFHFSSTAIFRSTYSLDHALPLSKWNKIKFISGFTHSMLPTFARTTKWWCFWYSYWWIIFGFGKISVYRVYRRSFSCRKGEKISFNISVIFILVTIKLRHVECWFVQFPVFRLSWFFKRGKKFSTCQGNFVYGTLQSYLYTSMICCYTIL